VFTISLNNISYSIEKILGFVKIIGINPRNVALAVNITIRFIYMIIKESRRIYEAKRSRGADFLNKNLIKKIKMYASILIPVFTFSIKKADEFAQSLETKSYDFCEKYTTLKEFKFSKIDFLVYFVAAILGLVVIWCEI